MMLPKTTTEQRRYPRVSKNLPIKIKNGNFDIITETKNISCTGAYCQADKYIPVFTKIKTTILLPSKTKNHTQNISCSGVVVRVEKNDNTLEPQYNIAIYFNEISKLNMLKINRFVKNQPDYLLDLSRK